MSKIIKFAKVIRRNWKKSTVLFGLLAYGASYGVDRYQTFQMMRAYCEEARAYGEQVLPGLTKPKHVTVILNPEANNKKSNAQFEKFAAPLLHLAGYKVSIFQTESQRQALDLMQVMSNTDAVLVAGGDGTLHEVVTGLMRRPATEDESLPLGIIPVGKTNTVATHLFGPKSSSRSQLMAEAAMAVIREKTVSLDVMEITNLDLGKPIYALSCFEQGAFAEVELKVPKYWYLGSLKDKFAYFINSFKNHIPVDYSRLLYVPPCEGCSKCYIPPKLKEQSNQSGRWWSAFITKKADVKVLESSTDYSKVFNENCGQHIELPFSYSNFSVCTSSCDQSGNVNDRVLWIKMYPKNLSFKEFLMSGLSHRKSKLQCSSYSCTVVNAGEVKVGNGDKSDSESSVSMNSSDAESSVNNNMSDAESSVSNNNSDAISSENHNKSESDISETQEVYCYVDNEKYKMQSCDITLLPKKITVFG